MSFSWEFIGPRGQILSILQPSILGGVQTAPEALSGTITFHGDLSCVVYKFHVTCCNWVNSDFGVNEGNNCAQIVTAVTPKN